MLKCAFHGTLHLYSSIQTSKMATNLTLGSFLTTSKSQHIQFLTGLRVRSQGWPAEMNCVIRPVGHIGFLILPQHVYHYLGHLNRLQHSWFCPKIKDSPRPNHKRPPHCFHQGWFGQADVLTGKCCGRMCVNWVSFAPRHGSWSLY